MTVLFGGLREQHELTNFVAQTAWFEERLDGRVDPAVTKLIFGETANEADLSNCHLLLPGTRVEECESIIAATTETRRDQPYQGIDDGRALVRELSRNGWTRPAARAFVGQLAAGMVELPRRTGWAISIYRACPQGEVEHLDRLRAWERGPTVHMARCVGWPGEDGLTESGLAGLLMRVFGLSARQSQQFVRWAHASTQSEAREEPTEPVSNNPLDDLMARSADNELSRCGTPRQRTVEIRGGSRENIRQAAHSSYDCVRRCYERGALQEGREGTVVVRFSFDESGVVSNLTLLRSTLEHPETEQCVMDVVRHTRFPIGEAGATRVTYPYRLSRVE
ncbi:MAG: energy transducer TonB [Deltaproteobacteria bacterium]|nr:energy transducer TonB [Deltaproteobacteria bacterium]